jgi:hypothetical protein
MMLSLDLTVVVRAELSSIDLDVFGGCEASGKAMDASAQCPDVGGFGVVDRNLRWLPIEDAAGITTTSVGFAIRLGDVNVVQLEGGVCGANVDN